MHLILGNLDKNGVNTMANNGQLFSPFILLYSHLQLKRVLRH